MYNRDLAYIHHRGFGEFARSAAPAILSFLREAGMERSNLVVDLGCGSGVLAGERKKSDYSVIGVDISPEMVKLARAEVDGAAFAYATDGDRETTLRDLFTQCANALSPGAPLLFDVIERRSPCG